MGSGTAHGLGSGWDGSATAPACAQPFLLLCRLLSSRMPRSALSFTVSLPTLYYGLLCLMLILHTYTPLPTLVRFCHTQFWFLQVGLPPVLFTQPTMLIPHTHHLHFLHAPPPHTACSTPRFHTHTHTPWCLSLHHTTPLHHTWISCHSWLGSVGWLVGRSEFSLPLPTLHTTTASCSFLLPAWHTPLTPFFPAHCTCTYAACAPAHHLTTTACTAFFCCLHCPPAHTTCHIHTHLLLHTHFSCTMHSAHLPLCLHCHLFLLCACCHCTLLLLHAFSLCTFFFLTYIHLCISAHTAALCTPHCLCLWDYTNIFSHCLFHTLCLSLLPTLHLFLHTHYFCFSLSHLLSSLCTPLSCSHLFCTTSLSFTDDGSGGSTYAPILHKHCTLQSYTCTHTHCAKTSWVHT